jgi:hypothetical protein
MHISRSGKKNWRRKRGRVSNENKQGIEEKRKKIFPQVQ